MSFISNDETTTFSLYGTFMGGGGNDFRVTRNLLMMGD